MSDDVDRGQTNYRSYLLRLWWAEDEGKTALRILIEDPTTSKRTGFSSLEDLVAFLYMEATLEEPKETTPEESPGSSEHQSIGSL